MNNDLLLNGLLNYVDGQDQFAVMIDGAWGSGKTYFLKEKVIPELQKTHKVVYFSIYGYESLRELKSDLMGNLFISSLGKDSNTTGDNSKVDDILTLARGSIDAVANKLASFKPLANAAGNLVIKKQLEKQSIGNAPVLVIDDLERISRKINISDLLGYILTSVIEPYGYRVIIVGNSKEIPQSEASEFEIIREKVVSRVFPFSYDYKNIKPEFFVDSDILFLQKNSDWLVEILSEYARHNEEQINLRTLEFILSTFKIVDKSLNCFWLTRSEGKYENNQIQRSAFLNLFVIANEYREGRLKRENLPELDRLLYTKNFFFMHLNKKDEKSTAELITDRYHSDYNLSHNIMYSREINSAIFDGVFEPKEFIEKWISVFSPQKNVSNLEAVGNFRAMTDEELKTLQNKLFSDAAESEINIGDLLSIINNFLFFDQEDLNFLGDRVMPDLLRMFDRVVRRKVMQGNQSFDWTDITFRYDAISRNDDVLKKINESIKLATDIKRTDDTKRLVEAIFENDIATIREIKQTDFKINIFRIITDVTYLNKYLFVKRSKSYLLDRYLYSEYISISNSKQFHSNENTDISVLIDRITVFIDSSPRIGKVDIFNLKKLLTTLKEILTKLTD